MRHPGTPAPLLQQSGNGAAERGKALHLLEKASRGRGRARHREDQNERAQGAVGRQRGEADLFSLLHKQHAFGKVKYILVCTSLTK